MMFLAPVWRNRFHLVLDIVSTRLGYNEIKVPLQTTIEGKLKALFADQCLVHVQNNISFFDFKISKLLTIFTSIKYDGSMDPTS